VLQDWPARHRGGLHLTANWTAVAKFDGEFASTSQTYAGTGALRYSW
jgi:hypothetical protein